MLELDKNLKPAGAETAIGGDILSELARLAKDFDIPEVSKPSIEDLNFLRQVDGEIGGDTLRLDLLTKQLELQAADLSANFMTESSFHIDGIGSVEDIQKVESTKRSEMAKEHERRLQMVFDICQSGIDAGKIEIEDGGIKSSMAIERRMSQAQQGSRINCVPDMSRLRIIFEDLACLDSFFDQLVGQLAAQDFGYVGCRNKYHLERDINIHDQNKQVVGKCEYPGTRWRCINTVWSCAGDDQDLARVPTEIQLVTRAMQRVGKFRHPLRTFSRRVDLVGLVGQSQAWLLEDMVEKLTAKVAVYDLKNFLNNKKV